MPRFQFTLAASIDRARAIGTHPGDVTISLPGVMFAGYPRPHEQAVLRLMLMALQLQSGRYWDTDECCEGCVGTSLPSIDRIESTVQLASRALGPDPSPACAVLVAALVDGFREFRQYLSNFSPDREHPWGTGSRSNYLHAMHALRHHLISVLHEVSRIADSPFGLPSRVLQWPCGCLSPLETWPRSLYSYAWGD